MGFGSVGPLGPAFEIQSSAASEQPLPLRSTRPRRLANLKAVAKAVAAFRQKQMGPLTDKRRSATKVTELTNLEVKKRYAFPLSCAVTRNTVVMLPKCKLHDLRGLYGAMTWELFAPGTLSFSRHLMAALGHRSLNESLSYTHWRVEGCEGLRGKL